MSCVTFLRIEPTNEKSARTRSRERRKREEARASLAENFSDCSNDRASIKKKEKKKKKKKGNSSFEKSSLRSRHLFRRFSRIFPRRRKNLKKKQKKTKQNKNKKETEKKKEKKIGASRSIASIEIFNQPTYCDSSPKWMGISFGPRKRDTSNYR